MDELLESLQQPGVRCLLIGGQAMRLLGMPRFSMDWDFLIPPRDEENFGRLNRLLDDELDLPLVPLGESGENFVQTYQTRFGVIQFHLGVPGIKGFADAEAHARDRLTESGLKVRCASGHHLLAMKRAANRPQDQLDIQYLEELERLGKLD